MKKITGISICLFFVQCLNAQETIKHFEFGSTLITVNSFNNEYYSGYDPAVEFINGLFFRYTKKRVAFRAHTSYSDFTVSRVAKRVGQFDPEIGATVNNRKILIGSGIQLSLLKHRDWLYGLLDLSYRHTTSSGSSYGFMAQRFVATANGVDAFLGVGVKLKILKSIYLSPEVGFCSSTQVENTTRTSIDVFTLSGQEAQYNYSFSETTINPILKLHLTVKF